MARQSILDRFRPVGAPGLGGATGVPLEDERGPAWELAPVFAALAPAITAADEAIAEADHAAKVLTSAATEQATQQGEQARLEAESLRAAAATRVLSDGQLADTANLGAAKKRAGNLTRRAHRRLPSAVDQVITAVIAEVKQP